MVHPILSSGSLAKFQSVNIYLLQMICIVIAFTQDQLISSIITGVNNKTMYFNNWHACDFCEKALLLFVPTNQWQLRKQLNPTTTCDPFIRGWKVFSGLETRFDFSKASGIRSTEKGLLMQKEHIRPSTSTLDSINPFLSSLDTDWMKSKHDTRAELRRNQFSTEKERRI